MSLCLNPTCPQPQNSSGADTCAACGHRLRLLDRYRPQLVLGQGGFGRTYLALDEGIEPPTNCVIKQILPVASGLARSDPERGRQRFWQEAEQLAILGHHPQIPQLLDAVETDDGQFLVQQYIAAPNLEQLAGANPWSEAQVRQLLEDLLLVLQFVHQHQVIHRDIKPANILVPSPPDPPVLVDFGSSKYATDPALVGKTGTVIGSAGYTAPEQALGKAVFASDIYSLGVTCLHLLTGLHPFDLYAVSEDSWQWRPFVQVPVSQRLARILDRMVSRRVKDRYATAQEAMAELAWAGLSAKTMVGIGAVGRSQPPPSPPWPCYRTLNAHGAVVYGIRFSPSGRAIATATGDGGVDLWDWTRGERIQRLGRSLRWLGTGHRGAATAVAFTPNGHYLLSGGQDGQLIVWDLDTYRGERGATFPGWLTTELLITADGQTLITGTEAGQIQFWDLATLSLRPTLALRQTLTHHQERITALALGPGSLPQTQQLVSVSWDKTLRYWSLPSGRLIQTLTAAKQRLTAVTCHPQDGRVFSGDTTGQLQLWTPGDGERGRLMAKYGDPITALALSPDGRWLAVGLESGQLPVWDLSGQAGLTHLRHGWSVQSLVFSPDSTWLGSGSADETVKVWQVPITEPQRSNPTPHLGAEG